MGKEIHVPDSIDTIDGGEISFNDVHNRFTQSKFGGFLDDQVRYLRYKPASISKKAWARAPLGVDVNNLRHMPLTTGLTRAYLKNQIPEKALNRSDSQILMLASTTHDWAEAITDDVTFDLKTKEADDDEASMMLFLLKRILGGKLSRETLMQVYSTVKDKNSRLGSVFNAIERVGYMRTGLNAWTASIKPRGAVMRGLSFEQEDELREALQWLASNVAGNQVVKLMEYADAYRPVGIYMESVRDRISDLFAGMPVSVFDKYETDGEKENEQMEQVQRFLIAHKAWKNHRYGGGSGRETSQKLQSTGGVAG